MIASPPLSPALSESITRRLSSLHPESSLPTPGDCDRAIRLLNQQRVEVQRSKAGTFTYKEANPVLAKIARGLVSDVTPGLIQALFEHGASVNIERPRSTNFIKSFRNVDQIDIRSHILSEAVQNCSEPILYTLAQHADEIAVNEALPAAITSGNTTKTSIMLARGADASRLCGSFLAVIESGSDEMVEILLRDTNGACQKCRNEGFLKSIVLKNHKKALLLLSKGADVTYSDGAGITSAIEASMEDVTVLALSKGTFAPGFLDVALSKAYHRKQYQTFMACLAAGAKGTFMDTTLVAVVRNKELSLAIALIQHGANVATDNGAAIQAAVLTGEVELLRVVLQGGVSATLLSQAIPQISMLKDLEVAYPMIDMLISAGLHGNCVTETLVSALDTDLLRGNGRRRMDLVRLLLLKGEANINLNGGQPIVRAISNGQLEALALLLQHHPSIATLEASLKAAMNIFDAPIRRQVIELVLVAGPARSAGHLKRVALVLGARELLLDVIEFLAPLSDSPQPLIVDAFVSATSGHKDWLNNNGISVIEALLHRGASGQVVDTAFCEAALKYHRDGFDLLSNVVSRKCLEEVMYTMIKSSIDWQSEDNLWIVDSLLTMGCEGKSVSMALQMALSSYVKGIASEDLIDTLLLADGAADINSNRGEALKIAIRAGDLSLLEKLISLKPQQDTLSQAFATTISTTMEDSVTLRFIEALTEASHASNIALDLETTLSLSGLSSIAACISAHPKSTVLLKCLLGLGCSSETEFSTRLGDNRNGEGESCTALLWAVAQEKRVSTSVIEALIKAKANINFTSSKSRSTPLIMAARACRGEIVSMLIEAGANTLARDAFDRSALFYASQLGNLESVKALIHGKAAVDDGSLHEGSRSLHAKIVATLIKAKHQPNFPSLREEHNGRTALQELAHRCQDGGDVVRLEETIKALIDGKANPLQKCLVNGKNSLFLAMENPQPLAVTKALINRSMWSHMNHDENLFVFHAQQSGTKWNYSPTMYLRMGLYGGKPEYLDVLHKLLIDSQCKDRYYPEYGPGERGSLLPIEAVGMPDKIVDEDARLRAEVDKQRKRDQEHQAKLRYLTEEAAKKAEIDGWRHAQKLEQTQWEQQNDLVHQVTKTDLQHQALEQKNAIVAASQQQAEIAKLRNAHITVTALQTQQNLKLDFQQQEAKAKIAQQKWQNQLAQEAAAHKLEVQRQQADVKTSQQLNMDMIAKEAAARKIRNQSKQQSLQQTAERHNLEFKTKIRRKELAYQQSMHDMKMEELQAKNKFRKH